MVGSEPAGVGDRFFLCQYMGQPPGDVTIPLLNPLSGDCYLISQYEMISLLDQFHFIYQQKGVKCLHLSGLEKWLD